MALIEILRKFEDFDPATDCLVMVGKDDRFGFYAPDQFTKAIEGGNMPPHVFIAMAFGYLASHADQHPEIVEGLRAKVMEWIHEA